MKFLNTGLLLVITIWVTSSCTRKEQTANPVKSDNMIIRISEIVIDTVYLYEYISILKEEAEASIRLEEGVISIYPMFQKGHPTEIRILEIYRDRLSYESHLQTPHFKKYKTTTLNMVKSLKLVDMQAIDEATMPGIFNKLNQ